jgi:hypothetical protein
MNITAIVWDRVEVTCQQDPSKSETLTQAAVTFVNGYLVIHEYKQDALSRTYARAKVVSLSPREAIFEAHWFSSTFGKDDFDELLPVRVECTF